MDCELIIVKQNKLLKDDVIKSLEREKSKFLQNLYQMWGYPLLVASVIGIQCNEAPPIFDSAVSCPSRSDLMKSFAFAANYDLVSIATCEKSINSEYHNKRSESIVIDNLCNRSALANLDEISCESDGGILGSVA